MEDAVARGWAGGTGSIGRDGGGGGVRAGGAGLNERAGRTRKVRRAVRSRSVGCAGAHLARLVGPLGPSDGSLVHHPR
jgi:hypothetical protein